MCKTYFCKACRYANDAKPIWFEKLHELPVAVKQKFGSRKRLTEE